MKTSKYAPKTPLEQLKRSQADRLKQDKDKVTRLLVRLRWKAELLMVSYYKAMEVLQTIETQNGLHPPLAKQAESMFKIDFFEFYTFLERYITLSLATLGISISAAAPRENVNALRYLTNPDLQRTRPLAAHAFHANLLAALDDEACPLHGTLGAQDVRIQLGLAKDYRNAWKDADEQGRWERGSPAPSGVKLPDLRLEGMLRVLVEGCAQARDVVQAFAGAEGVESRDFELRVGEGEGMVLGDVPLEYMDDAMELD
ncbi:hypothetical protein EJ07DRAFT_139233 [Lizonia empirigonia]|nr:hypothetical protein EJ07DRAFT_139233 [Lizonia empirigonia]